MTLKQRLIEEMKSAMKAHDTAKLEVIRFLLAEIKNVEIDQGELNDQAIQKIVSKQIKQIKEAIEQFERGGRKDLVAAEQEKMKVLMAYLPPQLDESALIKLIDQVIAENSSLTHPGRLTGLVMKQVAGKADGAKVAQLIQQRLAA